MVMKGECVEAHVNLFMLMNHEYCERSCSKMKRTLDTSLLLFYPHFLIFKMEILILDLLTTKKWMCVSNESLNVNTDFKM